MPEIIANYSDITAQDGSVWSARAVTRTAEGHWEGWIEFIPRSPGHIPLRTRAETTQPNHGAVKYWASGLTVTYLEGALERARTPQNTNNTNTIEPPTSRAIFDAPATSGPLARNDRSTTRPAPILDPVAVYAQGERLLQDQLAALDREHLREIALAYELVTIDAAPTLTSAELTDLIVAAARSHVARAR